MVTVCMLASACGRVGFDPVCADEPACSATESAYARAVLADAPLAYFRFDEPTGPIARSQVGTATGSYEGAFTFGVASPVDADDTSVRFDGATTRIPLGDVFRFGGNAPYTIEVWIRPRTVESTRFIVDRRTTATPPQGYTMYVGATYFLFARQSDAGEVGYVGTPTPMLDRWTYSAVTYDGAIHTMYIDGVKTQDNLGIASEAIGEGAGHFTIGDSWPGQFFKFDGEIDELAIYDRPLTAEQIAVHEAAAER